jgi:hypothetical protein
VDGGDWCGHSWVETLSDCEGARYLSAQAVPPLNHPNVSVYRRQVALLDVDQGGFTNGTPTGPGGMFPQDTASPNSYVFDVVRVAGGKVHTYCFHGPVEDQLVTNMKDKVGGDKLTEPDTIYLNKFGLDEKKSAGDAPEIVEATWRVTRASEKGKSTGNEMRMAPDIWYTRLHVFGQKGARVLTGASECQYKPIPYTFTNLFVQQRSEAETDAVFPALIEPYVGEPFVTSRQLLSVRDNEQDALRAVALEVKTKNGHTDLLFADGRPGKIRQVGRQQSAVSVSGEFAYCSTDANGLRQATITGGVLLQTPTVTLKLAARERTGKVTQADYAGKTMVIDQAWPAASLLGQRTFEIGRPGRMTTYTIGTAKADAKTTRITVTEGAQLYLSRVTAVNAEKRQVQCVLAMPPTVRDDNRPGASKYWVAANEAGTKFWRAVYLGPAGASDTKADAGAAANAGAEGGAEKADAEDAAANTYVFQLDGAVSDADFGHAGGFCLFEYGVGDTVRQSVTASLRRVDPGEYELTADVDVEVTLPGGKTRNVTVEELARANGAVRLAR